MLKGRRAGNTGVSGTPVFVYEGTWSGRPAASANTGQFIVVTDTPTWTQFYSDGTNWITIGTQCVARDETLYSGINNTSEQYMANLLMPAGMLYVGAHFMWRFGQAKSDATDAMTSSNCRIGPLGTISDTSTGLFASVTFTAAQRSTGCEGIFNVVSSSGSKFKKYGSGGANVPSYPGAVNISPTAYGTLGPALDLTVGQYFGVTMLLAAATGTTLPQLTSQSLWLMT